jgi:hypothetical protein
VPFPILYNERVKDILFEKGGTILIHCVTTIDDPYMFTICVDYSICLFDLPVFLKSLENSDYKSLMTEIEDQVDKKKWLKEGLPFKAKAMASWVKQLIVSLDVMTASNKLIFQQMRTIELIGNVTSKRRSIGSTLPIPPSAVSSTQGPPSTRSRVIVPSSSKRQKPGAMLAQSNKMRVSRPAKISTVSAITEVLSAFEPGEKTNCNETKTMYKKFWTKCQDCFVFEVDTKYSKSIE